ncbi:MAG: ParA family protein [Proteobacteria bacterium]|nr:ParA family protein [Desulfobulbaceae bacterium]MBU4152952.1 ParA family protein [Pseudomonadota bacterium]
MKKIIAIINQKGGVGKTTTSLYLSRGLAQSGKKVLLIDLDPQAHSTISLGYDPHEMKYGIHDVLLRRLHLKEAILPTEITNLSLVSSHIRLDKAELELIHDPLGATKLKNTLKKLDADFDFIVIDCRPTLGTLTYNALFACHMAIVPCDVSRYSLEGMLDLMDTIRNIEEGLNSDFIIKVLLNRFDSRKKVSNDWFLQQLDNHRGLLLNTFIRVCEPLNQAHMTNASVLNIDPKSSGALDYKQLTHEILSLCQN